MHMRASLDTMLRRLSRRWTGEFAGLLLQYIVLITLFAFMAQWISLISEREFLRENAPHYLD